MGFYFFRREEDSQQEEFPAWNKEKRCPDRFFFHHYSVLSLNLYHLNIDQVYCQRDFEERRFKEAAHLSSTFILFYLYFAFILAGTLLEIKWSLKPWMAVNSCSFSEVWRPGRGSRVHECPLTQTQNVFWGQWQTESPESADCRVKYEGMSAL